jgi:nitrate/TMAO reductase-like tetraheme cytochrome c subunit
MNEETKNTFNNQMIPKIKKIEGSIVDIYSKIDSTMLENQLRSAIAQEMEERLKDTRLLKVRNCTKAESSRIGSISGMNEDRLTSR